MSDDRLTKAAEHLQAVMNQDDRAAVGHLLYEDVPWLLSELERSRHADEKRQEMQRRWQASESELAAARRRIDVLENHCPYKPADSILRKLFDSDLIWVDDEGEAHLFTLTVTAKFDASELAYLQTLTKETPNDLST